MSEEASRFRKSAQNCRELASRARDEVSRTELLEIALELETEADKIEAEETDRTRT
jgi:hypothetical protein